MTAKILIVEDQFIEANNLRLILEKAGLQICGIAKSVEQALKILTATRPDIVLLDIFLKGALTGIDLANHLTKMDIPFIYLSANSNETIFDAAKATRPYGFLVKPFREKDILIALDIAMYRHHHLMEFIQKQHNYRSEESIVNEDTLPSAVESYSDFKKEHPHLKTIVGQSASLLKVLHQVQQVADSETTILILGETGVGKEGIAKAIHYLSARKEKPLVKINCAAIPANLIESELFGHEKGAFTGAQERRIGKFEQANGGTIFLDEIGEMPIEFQSKLLRVIQEKELERVGGKSTIKIDVRIIAATNRNLYKEVAAGNFRIDLYYRINVVPIKLPALRERKEDLRLLVKFFLQKHKQSSDDKEKQFNEECYNKMMLYSWPGNIRELEYFVQRHILLSPTVLISKIDLPEDVIYKEMAMEEPRSFKSIDETDRDYIIGILKECNGKISGKNGAAQLLKVTPTVLTTRMKKLGIVWKYILQ